MGWWEGLAEVEPLLRCSQPPEKPHEDAPPGALVGSVGSVGVEAGEGGGCGAGAADLVPDDAAGGGSGVGVSACSSSLRAEAPSTDISITGGPALLPLLMLTRPEGCCSCCCCCGGDPEAVGFRGAGWEGGAAGAGGPAEVGAVVRAADGGWCVDGALLVAPPRLLLASPELPCCCPACDFACTAPVLDAPLLPAPPVLDPSLALLLLLLLALGFLAAPPPLALLLRDTAPPPPWRRLAAMLLSTTAPLPFMVAPALPGPPPGCAVRAVCSLGSGLVVDVVAAEAAAAVTGSAIAATSARAGAGLLPSAE
mmetsp:Transcript_3849/g.10424  ORF Transcript_3849/g.10424 Transcript_3849/m.10424 type:complete len:310 (+) Transcript_3849:202-1131(+)